MRPIDPAGILAPVWRALRPSRRAGLDRRLSACEAHLQDLGPRVSALEAAAAAAAARKGGKNA